MKKRKFVVITTINSPRPQLEVFAQLGWHVIVVGDKKTPSSEWITYTDNRDITYLDIKSQEDTWPELSAAIGYNTYARKNFGYLWAIRLGADAIWETDDDTFPIDSVGDPTSWIDTHYQTEFKDAKVWNPFRVYAPSSDLWPRGIPLEEITLEALPETVAIEGDGHIKILQTLVNNEPDLDAIYRLTKSQLKFEFPNSKATHTSLRSLVPGNTQSTFWLDKNLFEFLYFPVHVSNRFADILKMYVAQTQHPITYAGFLSNQERNPHDYMVDFRQEVELYLKVGELVEIVLEMKGKCLTQVYDRLVETGICSEAEVEIYRLWGEAVREINHY